MTELKDFLSELATDAERLGRFVQDPEDVMSEADLGEEDRAALRSGFANMIYARMSGLDLEEAFDPAMGPAQQQPASGPAQQQPASGYAQQQPASGHAQQQPYGTSAYQFPPPPPPQINQFPPPPPPQQPYGVSQYPPQQNWRRR